MTIFVTFLPRRGKRYLFYLLMDIIQKLKKTITSVVFSLICLTAAYGQSDSLEIRFLGTGAADWHGPDKNGEQRRLSSILVDDAALKMGIWRALYIPVRQNLTELLPGLLKLPMTALK